MITLSRPSARRTSSPLGVFVSQNIDRDHRRPGKRNGKVPDVLLGQPTVGLRRAHPT